MELEMASEFKDFLATLEPVWEDSNEFDWLKEKTDLIVNKIKQS
jgi:hypothetical protein|tara:strand:- start:7330 stop:7461 length:132 start_codon:yes stop_codon:yes gene_type:complete